MTVDNGNHRRQPIGLDGLTPDDEDLCLYIAELCGELRSLTQSARFRTINYLLDMARLEAERTAKEFRAGNGRR